ncbi:hypothetical protein ACIHCV_42085 [Streptomyces sp. NPDC051956]|uniref:hypothetical protein n=1 Tax=Streptomyces sp. NPDC051956 TaxID=3365677 RepID=UPI0037D67BB8
MSALLSNEAASSPESTPQITERLMGQINSAERRRNEEAIRAAVDRLLRSELLRGELPPGGRCGLKTLAAEAGVNGTGFYPKKDPDGPYQHLADEFVRRLTVLHEVGILPDPWDAQIARLKAEIGALRPR